MITSTQLAQCCDCSVARAEPWTEPLNVSMALFQIDTPARRACFLAQIGHESGRLRYVRELWGPTPQQARYEGRDDLGNTQPGDGFRYRGRGLIQTTGRANYASTREGLRARMAGVPDFEANPDLLEQPRWAALSAGWFWTDFKKLNPLADAGDFERITRRINGGTNGLDDRLKLWAGAKAALGLT